jgi:hypothetical protein
MSLRALKDDYLYRYLRGWYSQSSAVCLFLDPGVDWEQKIVDAIREH